jgi:hypothetical protein
LDVQLEGSGIQNGGRLENLLGGTPAAIARRGVLEVDLPPHSAAIYR